MVWLYFVFCAWFVGEGMRLLTVWFDTNRCVSVLELIWQFYIYILVGLGVLFSCFFGVDLGV